jgi:hypothetical protein
MQENSYRWQQLEKNQEEEWQQVICSASEDMCEWVSADNSWFSIRRRDQALLTRCFATHTHTLSLSLSHTHTHTHTHTDTHTHTHTHTRTHTRAHTHTDTHTHAHTHIHTHIAEMCESFTYKTKCATRIMVKGLCCWHTLCS